MTFSVFQILSLVLVFTVFSTLFRHKIIVWPIVLLGVLLATIEVSAVILSNSLIDYKYYIHFDTKVLAETGGFFVKEGIIIACFFLFIVSLTFLIRKFLLSLNKRKLLIKGTIILASILFMFINKGILSNINEIIKLQTTEAKLFNNALKELGFVNYTSKEDVEGSKGKNIIVVFLESLENGYLKPSLNHLTPNLTQLSKEHQYYTMSPLEGSDFTTGAFYTYLSGVPMLYKKHGNYIFDNALNLKIPTINTALKKAEYNQLFMTARANFGVGEMMDFFDVPVKSNISYDKKYHINHWGMHDKDLFDLAKKEITNLSQKDKPFAFFMTTISTHYPDGVYDKRFENELPKQRSDLEFMVSATDRMIGELVYYLKSNNLWENTALYIMPDHLLMGKMSEVISDLENPRDLFLISNVNSSYNTSESILPIDVPRIILEGAEVEHNISLLTDQIEGDKVDFINKNKSLILALNEAALYADTTKKVTIVDKIKIKKDTIQLKSKSNYSTILVRDKQYEAKKGINLLVKDNNQFNFESYNVSEDSSNYEKCISRLDLLIKNKIEFAIIVQESIGNFSSNYNAKLKKIGLNILSQQKGKFAYVAYSKYGLTSEKASTRIVSLDIPIKKKSKRSPSQIIENAKDKKRFIAHAGGIVDGITYTNSLEALDLSYRRGFRYFELDFSMTSDDKYVATHDWTSWANSTNYDGPTPDLKTFLAQKINGKYTSLSLDGVNDWFKKHPDAVLVTDKISSPKDFVPLFIDHNRLIMEVFSMDAAIDAKELNILDVFISENLFNSEFGNDKINTLIEYGFSSISISRKTIENNPWYYNKVKDAGIKIYAFHVNYDPFKDESYIVKDLMDVCYGMYADYWDFERLND